MLDWERLPLHQIFILRFLWEIVLIIFVAPGYTVLHPKMWDTGFGLQHFEREECIGWLENFLTCREIIVLPEKRRSATLYPLETVITPASRAACRSCSCQGAATCPAASKVHIIRHRGDIHVGSFPDDSECFCFGYFVLGRVVELSLVMIGSICRELYCTTHPCVRMTLIKCRIRKNTPLQL